MYLKTSVESGSSIHVVNFMADVILASFLIILDCLKTREEA